MQVIILLLALLMAPVVSADSPEEIRLAVASRLFPSLLAADMQIEQKLGADNRLLILVVYLDQSDAAEIAAAEIADVDTIRKMKIDVRVVSMASLASHRYQRLAGLFIAGKLDDALQEVVSFARERRVITFSPYPGDVEMGVAGGIQVKDRILPYINLKALREANVTLRPFYLKVAETYEPH